MHFIWMTEDESPLSKAAVEVGVQALATALGAEISPEAVVVLRDKGVLRGQPLACTWGPDGSQTWTVDYRSMATTLFAAGDKVMRDAGVDPSDPSFERQARRLLHRRFPHWSPETMTEIVSILPRLHNLALAMDEGPLDLD